MNTKTACKSGPKHTNMFEIFELGHLKSCNVINRVTHHRPNMLPNLI